VRQRSSRFDVLCLLAVASLHRVRHRCSRVAVASLRLLGAAEAIFFPSVSWFLRVFYQLPELKDAGRWLFLIGSDVPEGRAARTTTTQIADRKKKSFAQELIVSAESPQ
jgi:hypothetical protein